MYRIELTPGEEALFRNIEELAKAIHSGVVGSHARIWHGASNKWLPIDFHPHYKIAKERPVAPAVPAPIHVAPSAPKAAVSPFAPPSAPAPQAAAPVPPAPTPVAPSPEPVAAAPAPVVAAPVVPASVPAPRTRDLQFIELGPIAPAPVAAAAPLFIESAAQSQTPRHIEALVAIAEKHPAPVIEAHEEVLIDISTPRRKLNPRLAGMAAGVLLAAAAGGALLARGSSERPAPEADLAVASTSLAATPNQGFEIIPAPNETAPAVAFRGNRAAEPVAEPVPAKDSTPAPAPVVPNAPKMSAAALRVGNADITGIQDDRAELENRLRATGFTNLLAESRLTAGNVGTTRLSVAGAAGLVRTFRAKATIDETDSGARMADALLADLDAALAILAGQEGGYEIEGGSITFRDSARAREFTAIRNRVGGRIATAANSGSPVAASLARSLGASRLPVVSQ
ncbi:MAG TPA: hypothetical protein VFT04_14590 [Gemmatimonadales bacterium]|nr:hypothetical protein [Gemmatimonadales bacterium]